MVYKILLLVNIIFSVAGQFFVKFGMQKVGLVQLNVNFVEKLKRMALTPYLWLAIVFYGVSFTLYAIVLSKVELSRAYPVAILAAVVLVFVTSVIFFNESVNIFKIIGLVLCIVGLVFLFR